MLQYLAFLWSAASSIHKIFYLLYKHKLQRFNYITSGLLSPIQSKLKEAPCVVPQLKIQSNLGSSSNRHPHEQLYMPVGISKPGSLKTRRQQGFVNKNKRKGNNKSDGVVTVGFQSN